MLPFEYADKQKTHGVDSDSDSDSKVDHGAQSCEGIDDFMAMVQKLEDQRSKVFNTANINIKKCRLSRLDLTITEIVQGNLFRLENMCSKWIRKLTIPSWSDFSMDLTWSLANVVLATTYMTNTVTPYPGQFVKFHKKVKDKIWKNQNLKVQIQVMWKMWVVVKELKYLTVKAVKVL